MSRYLGLVALAFLLHAVPASAATKSCGKVNSGFEFKIVAGTGVTCGKAQTIARAWHKGAVDQGKGPNAVQHVGPYTCRSKSAGDPEHVKVTCKKGKLFVRFVAGP
jgi:hypothetical protein